MLIPSPDLKSKKDHIFEIENAKIFIHLLFYLCYLIKLHILFGKNYIVFKK